MMIQIELYVDGVEEPAAVFKEVFGFVEIEQRRGWRNVQHKDGVQIMLYDPFHNQDYPTQWTFLPPSQTGHGVQIVLTVADAESKHHQLEQRGYQCSPLTLAPWGSLEFEFTLKQGYMIRVKQPISSPVLKAS